ncbi:hypothetical protein RFI_25577 [Reticulomyxa filosa]|uniref:E3 ubiquitin-protein ligase n=1 Tax=Reticulomyxa filosa TaxID=46433 RepID=X6MFH7_RETFI|nr:hypothetical protein RFI_25577 [Reticulomyxa filosa]|eukprot:ETO11800.1 hypothetical protein RFI_25577 [Reticulomyxa filosa]
MTEKDLLSRFESGWIHWCNNRQTLQMVENLLVKLIQLSSEPQYCVYHTKTSPREQRYLEYQLIHWLALRNTVYSELQRKVRLANEKLDLTAILQRIADYEEPQATESGKFRLKDEYYAYVNPYFHRYTLVETRQVLALLDTKLKHETVQDKKKEHKHLPCTLQWPTVAYSDNEGLELLGTAWMGILWTCLLHHVLVNDTKRFTQNTFTYCLRLITLAVDTLCCGKIKREDKLFGRIVKNLTTRFDFRLTNGFDNCQQAEVIKQREIRRLKQRLSDEHLHIQSEERLNALLNPDPSIQNNPEIYQILEGLGLLNIHHLERLNTLEEEEEEQHCFVFHRFCCQL